MRMVLLSLVIAGSLLAQKPDWVNNPGTFAAENFVAVGVAKNDKLDKAKEKAESKAMKGIEKMLKNKYKNKDIKPALASMRIHATWQDPATKYFYALALLPIEAIDKDYAGQKKLDKAKSSAMSATKMLMGMTNDPDVVIIKAEEGNDEIAESSDNDEESGVETKSEEQNEDQAVQTESKSEKKEMMTTVSGNGNQTDFKNKSLGNFKWIDQDGNSKSSFLGENLTATVAGYENFKPEEGNKKAPRLEYPNVTGDFSIETKFRYDWAKYYSFGVGLYALNGKQYVRTYVEYHGEYVYLNGYANDITLPQTEKRIEHLKTPVYFKLERKGYTFTAYYSTIDGDWIEIANVETEFPETAGVGIFFMNDDNDTAQCKVEYVKLKQ
ncbi:DUF1349 domain-containing protein [bacterium]|nr:DUF1349 domain-containing protein [bacterium]